MSASLLRLFVYGSLKRGEMNHEAYCSGFVAAMPATIRRLYQQSSGYPMLVVPQELVLAMGTIDPQNDLQTLSAIARNDNLPDDAGIAGDWERIEGEILTFDDPARYLQRLDMLEGFEPGHASLYHRVAIPVRHAMQEAVWTYVAPEGQLPKGCTRMGVNWKSK